MIGDKKQEDKDDTEPPSPERLENANCGKAVEPKRGKVMTELEAKLKHTVQCPVCRRHDFGIQDLNWSDIFNFSLIYVKVVVEAMMS